MLFSIEENCFQLNTMHFNRVETSIPALPHAKKKFGRFGPNFYGDEKRAKKHLKPQSLKKSIYFYEKPTYDPYDMGRVFDPSKICRCNPDFYICCRSGGMLQHIQISGS